MDSTIWTVGHSNRSFDDLVDVLHAGSIAAVVDVRRFPASRRNPQFDRDALATDLPRAGIDYRHEPRLGGRRRPREDSPNTAWRNAGFRGYADHMLTAEFASALDRLEAMATGCRTALMCAEAVPWRCHRSLIADALTVRGLRVFHLLGGARARAHRLTPFARMSEGRVVYPGLV